MQMKMWAAMALVVTCAACGGGGAEAPGPAATPAEGLVAEAPPAASDAGAAGSATRSAAAGSAAPRAAAASAPRPAAPVVREREVTIPAGTVLRVELTSAVSSDDSKPEDTVRATLRRAVEVDGAEVLPVGTEVVGLVTDAEQSGRVKGRARVAMRFTSVRHRSERVDIQADPVARQAEATKSDDAKKIGIGAGVGAAVGAIIGGGSGAAKGAAIGGGAGTGAVLATRGKEVRLGAGTPLNVKLTAPLVLRIAG
jgi:hypothetical protein